MSTEYTKNFSMLPNEVMEIDHKIINSTAKLVYSIIYTMLNSNDEFFMSNKSIAKKIGDYQPNAVPTLLKQLIDYGLITTRLAKSDNNQVIGRYIKLSNLYKKEAVKKSTGVVKKTVEGSQENVRGYSENHKRGSQKNVSKYISNNRLSNRLINNKGQKDHSTAKEIIDYLNQKLHKKPGEGFKHVSGNYDFIEPRLKDYSVQDLKRVIDNKVADWGHNAKMVNFLRPETLFRASKIEGYLNTTVSSSQQRETLPKWANDDYQPPKQTKKQVDMSKLEERLARRQANADN